LGISVEVLEDLSTKSVDDVGYLLLNTDKLQWEEGEELDLVDDTSYKLDSPFEHQSIYNSRVQWTWKHGKSCRVG
jgi:hypothetical protein